MNIRTLTRNRGHFMNKRNGDMNHNVTSDTSEKSFCINRESEPDID